MLIRSASGLRGIAEDHFTPDIIDKYICAFISNQNIKSCVIGRDGRLSGKQIVKWVIDSLHKNGINVDNCGLATTPTIQIMTEKENYDGGIVITASHNPSEYNGLKFLQADGTFLNPKQCEQLFKTVDKNFLLNNSKSLGVVSDYLTANQEHINKVLAAKCINAEDIRQRKFKVVIDAVNGSGSFILPMLCKELECEVFTINCNGDGNFARVPEPLACNLNSLEQKVIEVGADIGFATDPDGDRLSVVSNEGTAIGEEYSLVLAVKNFMNYKKSMVATNLSTSMMLDNIATEIIRTKIGEAHVVQKMNEFNIPIGGEGNGGVILKEVHLGRDSLVAVSMILSLISSSGRSIRDEIDEIPKYLMVKDKILVNTKIDFDNLETVFDCDEINKLDGIKFSWPDKWIHIRESNTEPIIRIFAEASTKEEVDDLINTLKNYLK